MAPKVTHKDELEEVILEASRVREAKEKSDRGVALLQYINTGILTLILAIAGMTSSLLIDVKREQTDFKVEITRQKTVQENNVYNIKDLDIRLSRLEINYIEDLKTWVETNYIRKSQTK